MPVAAPRRRPTKKEKFVIGPGHDGQSMSLDDFDQWPVCEGYFYELGRGIIQVSNVPLPSHSQQVRAVRNQFAVYEVEHPERVAHSGGGNEVKFMIASLQSERHPDWAIYKSSKPENTNAAWRYWIPAIAVEVVSPSSAKRDYEEKPQEYFEFGVQEYWIIDAFKSRMTVMQRYAGQWKKKIIKPGQKYTTALLPKFTFDLKKVLAVAK